MGTAPAFRSIGNPSVQLVAPKRATRLECANKDSRAAQLLYDLPSMATEKLTVTVQAASIRKLDRWVCEGRYANRSPTGSITLALIDDLIA